eukprot:3607089-Lingulodinium_polyedra.AAC.1
MACTDQLNMPALASAELISRRLMLTRDAHQSGPAAPDYSAADHYMGWGIRGRGAGVDPSLSQH